MKGLIVAALLCSIALPVIAQDLPRDSKDYLSFLPPGGLDKLYSSGELTNIAASINDLPLWQKSPFADTVRGALQGFDCTIAAEGFFLIDNPGVDPQNLDAKIFNTFTAFSSLKGIQVYSVSQGHMETFLFDASLVDASNRSKRLPDAVVTTVPAHADYVVYEKEEQTGDSYVKFHFDYDQQTDTFAVDVTNLTKMNYLIFTLVEPGNLHTYFYVVPCQDKLVLFGLTAVKTGHFFGLEKSKGKSFYYRMRALVTWFTDNLSK
jgi:hypothetical protein